jgi:hypothetical protein
MNPMSADLPDGCARLLAFQHGVIARWQAPAAGLSPAVIDAQLRCGRWRPLYRGVYAAYTGVPPRKSVLWAGVLRAGPGAVLSHHSAAELDGLADRPSPATHVTVGRGQHVRMRDEERHGLTPRIVVHRTQRLDAIRHPARTPPRTRIEETIIDLTQVSGSFDDAFSWLCRGCGGRLAIPEHIATALMGRSRVRWRDDILGALGVIGDGAHSVLEYRYIRDVEWAHRLPEAKRQVKTIRGVSFPRSQYLDNLYKPFGVGIELDGEAHHPVEDRWADIDKDNFCARLGIVTLRYSWANVTSRPCEVATAVSDALRQRGWSGRPARCGPDCAIGLRYGGRFSVDTSENRPP